MRGFHSIVDEIRQDVFKEVAKLAYEGGDLKRVDMIPYEMVRREALQERSDVFLQRAIITERVRLALGMPFESAANQVPISATIANADISERFFEEPLVNIIPFACNACPTKQLRITNNCQGCTSHPCQNVCPKDAIYTDEYNHCHIDQSKCIKCGKCHSQCPYNAISKIERPCAAACGMGAIESDERGRAKINYDKCVSCGQCIVNCPFSAIADKSQIFQVINSIRKGDKVIACVAPAFAGQFKGATPGKVLAAMKKLGFSEVVEVAIGADLCTIQEAHDFLEEVPEKIPFMATSCCPAWASMVKKSFPTMRENISMALTPMVITARMVKKEHPDARIVFVGPCSAKKLEASRKSVRSYVDFVLTFEEIRGMFVAKDVDFATIEEETDLADYKHGTGMARGFAVSGGVAAAVVEAVKHINPDLELKVDYATGLKECKKMLTKAKAGQRDGYLLEGMACPGGCIAGAGTIRPLKDATAAVEAFKNDAAEMSCANSPYLDQLPDVEEFDKLYEELCAQEDMEEQSKK